MTFTIRNQADVGGWLTAFRNPDMTDETLFRPEQVLSIDVCVRADGSEFYSIAIGPVDQDGQHRYFYHPMHRP
ncbi:hypothetical protein [Actibacterium sp. D379-3]